jgi:HD-like signal output (HDOD) protein
MGSSQTATAAPDFLTTPDTVASWGTWIRTGEWQETADTAVPPLPALAQEIVNLSLDPDVSASRITAIVSKDPVLATRVVQLANTAFSASATEIFSINEAVVRVGTGLVRNVMTAACLSALAQDPRIYGSRGRDYIDHSVGTAYIAWLLAETAGELPSEAFLYGLLHDVGKLLIIKLGRQAWRYSVPTPTDEELAAVLADQHTTVSGYLLRQWGLPKRLHDPLVYHHDPDGAENYPRAAAVTYAANRLAHRYGFACEGDDFDVLTDPVFTRLGIDAATLARVDVQAPILFELARKVAL